MNRSTHIVLVATLVLFVAAPAAAQEAAPAAEAPLTGGGEADAEAYRVAVVPLDQGAKSGALMERVHGLLDTAKFDVWAGQRLAEKVAKRQVPVPSRETAAKFSGLGTVIADGVESFFYKGHETAIERLTPVLDLGMNNLEVVARRPDFADQIYQAGLVVVRAYHNLEQLENAQATAQLLVRRLPGLQPSPSSVPPKIVRFMQVQRDALAKSNTMLKVDKIDGEGCTAYVNGTPIGEKAVPVSSRIDYFVTMDCGQSQAPVWRVRVPAGQTVVVPVAAGNPLDFAMADGTFESRRLAESHLRMVSFLVDSPRVLGVSQEMADDTEEKILVVRVEQTGRAIWSDSADERTISRVLARVLPEYEQGDGEAGAVGGPAVAAEADAGSTDWVGWSLVGGGAALTGVGVYAILAAGDRAAQIECSPDTAANPSAADCEGVETIYFANDQEISDAEGEVTMTRILGGTAIAAGLGLAGWGSWRLLSEPEPAVPNDGGAELTVQAGPTTDGARVGLRLLF